MIRGRSIALGQSSRSVHLSYKLLVSSVSMDWLWSTMGLTGNRCKNSAIRLVHSNADRWSIALLEELVMRLVSEWELHIH